MHGYIDKIRKYMGKLYRYAPQPITNDIQKNAMKMDKCRSIVTICSRLSRWKANDSRFLHFVAIM